LGKLTAIGVKNAKAGRHADGEGLYLLVKPTGARSWLLRVQVDGQRRDVGLGSVDLSPRPARADMKAVEAEEVISILHRRQLSLGEAREKAGVLRRIAKAGRDPVTERDKDRRAAPSFEKAAKACHEELSKGWDAKHAAAFLSSLKEHVFPLIGDMRVDQIEASHVRDALAPIWVNVPVMARKVRQRIGTVLNFSKSKGWRSTEAPGKAVTMGLSRQVKGGNFAAMPYAQVPDFFEKQRDKEDTMGRLALLFVIATAARSGEARKTRWSDIDEDGKLWSRPAKIMKGGVAHSVTLNAAAMAILERAKKLNTLQGDPLIFHGTSGKMLSDMTLSKVLKDAKQAFTPHGFRSSFRDWAAEKMPQIPDAVAEAALAHAVPDKVVAAYKRTKFLEMRRELLDGWSAYLTQPSLLQTGG
jgi:integrase